MPSNQARFNIRHIKCSLHDLNDWCNASNVYCVIDGDRCQLILIKCQ